MLACMSIRCSCVCRALVGGEVRTATNSSGHDHGRAWYFRRKPFGRGVMNAETVAKRVASTLRPHCFWMNGEHTTGVIVEMLESVDTGFVGRQLFRSYRLLAGCCRLWTLIDVRVAVMLVNQSLRSRQSESRSCAMLFQRRFAASLWDMSEGKRRAWIYFETWCKVTTNAFGLCSPNAKL